MKLATDINVGNIKRRVGNILTDVQQKAFDKFLKRIEQKDMLLLSSEERRIGKTTTLNELALTLQALGYIVYVLTPYQKQEYFAHKFISTDRSNYTNLNVDKLVIIVDEEKRNKMDEIIEYCDFRKIPVVGYVNYEFDKEIFNREYKCKWVGDKENGTR